MWLYDMMNGAAGIDSGPTPIPFPFRSKAVAPNRSKAASSDVG